MVYCPTIFVNIIIIILINLPPDYYDRACHDHDRRRD